MDLIKQVEEQSKAETGLFEPRKDAAALEAEIKKAKERIKKLETEKKLRISQKWNQINREK